MRIVMGPGLYQHDSKRKTQEEQQQTSFTTDLLPLAAHLLLSRLLQGCCHDLVRFLFLNSDIGMLHGAEARWKEHGTAGECYCWQCSRIINCNQLQNQR